jgi:hypothetical protein
VSEHYPDLEQIRAENPLREHYDAHLWEARILALYLARCAEVLADELRRVACAPLHVREDAMRHAKGAWYSNRHAMYGNPITGLFAVADDAGDELAEHFYMMLTPRVSTEKGQE